MRSRDAARLSSLVVLCANLAACDKPSSTTLLAPTDLTAANATTTAAVGTVTLAATPTTLVRGGTATAIVTLKSSAGVVLSGRSVAFASSVTARCAVTPARVTTSEAGTASATIGAPTSATPGDCTITATSEGKSGSVKITVTIPVASIGITPASANLKAAATATISAIVRDAAGAALGGKPVEWSSSVPTRCTVAPAAGVSGTNGITQTTVTVLATASTGACSITVKSEGKAATATINVTGVPTVSSITVVATPLTVKAPSTAMALATLKDTNGVVLGGRPVVWTSEPATRCTVAQSTSTSAANGTIQAAVTIPATASAGPCTITAASGEKRGSVTITIATAVNTVALSASTTEAGTPGTSVVVTATLKDAGGALLSGRQITWGSTPAERCTVSSTSGTTAENGTAQVTVSIPSTAGQGTCTIAGTSEGKSGSVTLNIVVPVATVTVAATPTSLSRGSKATVGALVKSVTGFGLASKTVSWSSNATRCVVTPTSATTNSTGSATTSVSVPTNATVGTCIITATSGGKSGTVTLTVK